ncbi:MAG: DEAD/DEAH box helicase [Leptolyngbyaceae cyanobacterium]
MASNAQVRQQNLIKSYEGLTAVQRSLVQVFAMLYEPVSRANALKCWNTAIPPFKKHQDFKPLNASNASSTITKLINQEVLIQNRGEGVQCPHPLIDIVVRDAVITGSFEPIAKAIAHHFSIRKRYVTYGPRYFTTEKEWLREFRIALYRQDQAEIDALVEDKNQAYWTSSLNFAQVLQQVLNNPFDPAWFEQLSPDFKQFGLRVILEDSVQRCVPADAAFELTEDLYNDGQASPDLYLTYAEQLWLRGYLQDAKEVLTEVAPGPAQREALLGAIAFLTGDNGQALAHYHLALKAVGKTQSAQADWFKAPAAGLYFFALLKDGSPKAHQEAKKYCVLLQKQSNHGLRSSVEPLLAAIQTQQGQLSKVLNARDHFADYTLGSKGVATLLEIYSLYWLDVKDLDRWLVPQLIRRYRDASQANYGWLALEIADLLARLQVDDIYGEMAEALREQTGSQPLVSVVERQEAWALSLNALASLTEANAPTAPPAQPTFRMAWRLRFSSLNNWDLTPLEQKLSVKGGWTKGKAIALKRFASMGERPDYMTPQDHQVVSALEVEYESRYYYYGSSKPYYSFGEEALVTLVGHPLVFWEGTDNVRVDVVAGEPELLVKRLSGDRLRLELSPTLQSSAKILAFKETPTRLKVIAIQADHHRIAELLGPNNRLEVPAQAEAQVLEAIASVSSLVTVQSDIGGGVAAEEVPADATPRLHLLPAGEGLKASLLVHPFPEGGAYYTPGKGGETVIAEVEGKRLQTQRDLKLEKQQAKAVKAACSILQDYSPKKGEWLIEEPEDCLELLVQLQELGDRVRIEWPEGEKLRVSNQLGLGNFKLNIRQQQDWFAASGEVQISDDQVMDLQQLMALLDNTPGKFIALSDGQFLALTEEFRQRLQTLKRLSDGKGKDLRIHGLAALALEDMVEDVAQLKVDKAWKTHIKHIKAARTIEPQLPSELTATLRDYQQDGYTWLARLANWGVGACLADDMGLGKTLQAIAVILSRSGPALVIAPTSVGMNWISEAERFAPTLTVKVFGTGDRQQMLDNLEPRDLVVCSYGLLQQEEVAAMLAKVTWQTIVLDEAQAIKNADTKRSQAAMALQGNFKVITTGTPIENHLGELWNLFRFINPGLLGSLDSFNQRFAYAIERDQDDAAREALRRLIQPFILRRTKDQVLKELPSRTEITLQVELSKQEMAFYEALRREAIDKLSDLDDPAGQKHLKVLAEIMRLRRACCNPNLVRPELSLPSAKLAQFGEVLTELLDNGHKALVFSQFVDHLTILRNHLDEQQIPYQYLDGSTPAKQRKKRVDAFQAGEGDVFFFSLKAGGTGLNLTAADYVIHMDPWWNPAVEDQASDRAHRIGQQRPVTIYRLVAKGTIEDKIVALHKTKRDLADSLLAGTDMSSKVSTEQLLSLIQQ